MTRSVLPRWLLPSLTLALAACSGGDSKKDPPPAARSDDASLAGLTVSAGALAPAFAPATTAYAVALPNGTAALTVTPTASHAAATVAVRQDGGAFQAVTSGTASGALTVPAVETSSTITVRVTAEDGTTTRDYVVTVTQEAPAATGFTIFTIGDSTMADYDPVTYPDQRGWGQMFRQFLVGDVDFVNAARNGRSSKSFYAEGLWTAVKDQLQPGDWVLIQFGHNDEKDDGLEGAGGIGTEAWGAYHDHLSLYVDETIALGATPVLVTPVVRRYFSGAALTAIAQHDLTGNGVAVGDANYPAAMRDVAAQKGVALVDMTVSTRALVEQYGPAASKQIVYVDTDDTHLKALGAMMYAQLAAAELVELGLLVDHLAPSADLVVSPTSFDFGARYAGTTLDHGFSVTGLALTPAEGNVTIQAPAGFQVAASAAGPFAATLQLPYTGGQLPPTTFLVRFAPAAEGTYGGDVTLTPDGGQARAIAVTGSALAAPSGTESIALYPLTADGTCTPTGLVSCAPEVFAGLTDHSYQIPNATLTTWTADTGETLVPDSTVTQRLTTPDGAWPAELDLNPDRYVEFAVTPAAGSTLTVDKVTLWAGAAGGNGIGYKILYSKQADFSSPQPLVESLSNVKNAMIYRTLSQVITVADGETLRVRVYPWNSAIATGKYLCLQSLSVHGWAE